MKSKIKVTFVCALITGLAIFSGVSDIKGNNFGYKRNVGAELRKTWNVFKLVSNPEAFMPFVRTEWINSLRLKKEHVKSLIDIVKVDNPDITELLIHHDEKPKQELLTCTPVSTAYGDLICLKPDMTRLKFEMVCGEVPSAENDSIILAFAGAFTGTDFYKGHSNVAGDHVVNGIRYRGFKCKRNTGAFTWSSTSGPEFYYQNSSTALDKAAHEDGMGFAQEMMIHEGKVVKTTRPMGNENVFRALCQDADGTLALYESQRTIKFGDFIEALLQQGVKEALYTDMGQGWNYCFYRKSNKGSNPIYLHSQSLPYASNFITIRIR